MRSFVLRKIAAVGLSGQIAFASSAIAADDLLRCTPQDFVGFSADGHLNRDNADFWLGPYSGFVVDLATGAIRFGDGNLSADIWTVVQQGNAASDYILVPRPYDPAQAVTDYLRIRAWQPYADNTPRPIRFFMVRLTDVFVGQCSPLR